MPKSRITTAPLPDGGQSDNWPYAATTIRSGGLRGLSDNRPGRLVHDSGRGTFVRPRSVPKVGRNAPCPCGSGRKYKRCCAAP